MDAKVVDTCVICLENHETKYCPSIPGLKTVFQEDPKTIESLCFVARRPWQGQQNQGFNNSMNFQSPPNWNPWQQSWSQSQNPFQTWVQGMQNPYGRFAQFYQCPPSFLNQQALHTDPVVDLFGLMREGSLGPFLVLDFPFERWTHSSTISRSES